MDNILIEIKNLKAEISVLKNAILTTAIHSPRLQELGKAATYNDVKDAAKDA